MKTTITVTKNIEADMHLTPEEIGNGGLRRFAAEHAAELKRLHPLGDVWIVGECKLYCDAAQRAAVSRLVGFVPASDFGRRPSARLEYGACDQFIFLWKHR